MAEKFLTQEQLSAFCSSLAMLLRSGASLSEASSLFEEDGMDTALQTTMTAKARYTTVCAAPLHTRPF